ESIARLPPLVLSYLGERRLIHLRVAPAGNECRHTADSVRTTPVACAHEQLRVRPHEWNGHRELRAVREDEIGPRSERLDDAEEIVPPAGVETRRVVTQLVQDLVHLERRQDCLDQNRCADGGAGNAEGGPG